MKFFIPFVTLAISLILFNEFDVKIGDSSRGMGSFLMLLTLVLSGVLFGYLQAKEK